MPLPPPTDRREIHLRDLTLRGYARTDGRFDIEGHLTDRKPAPFQVRGGPRVPPMAAIHDFSVRLVIDASLTVHEAMAAGDATPYGTCLGAPPRVERLVGANLGPGWPREVRARLGGVQGCTHLCELLITLGTAAFQTLVPYWKERGEEGGASEERLKLVDSCLAFAADGPVVARLWPALHRPAGDRDR